MTNNDITAEHPAADDSIRPFRISVPQADLDDLRDRLARHPLDRHLPGTGWSAACLLPLTCATLAC